MYVSMCINTKNNDIFKDVSAVPASPGNTKFKSKPSILLVDSFKLFTLSTL